jgi:hypothetical protein
VKKFPVGLVRSAGSFSEAACAAAAPAESALSGLSESASAPAPASSAPRRKTRLEQKSGSGRIDSLRLWWR